MNSNNTKKTKKIYKYVINTTFGGFLYKPQKYNLSKKLKQYLNMNENDFIDDDNIEFRNNPKVLKFFKKYWDQYELYTSYKILKIPYPPSDLIIDNYDGIEKIILKKGVWA